jgi:hypothetical protein
VKSHIGPSISLSAVIIRACDECSGKREFGKPCEFCGNKRPAKVTDLGVIASHQKSRWTRLKWNIWGFHAAQRRIKKTNKAMLKESIRGSV